MKKRRNCGPKPLAGVTGCEQKAFGSRHSAFGKLPTTKPASRSGSLPGSRLRFALSRLPNADLPNASSEHLVGIDQDCYRTFIYQRDLHHGLELARGTFNFLLANFRDHIFV